MLNFVMAKEVQCWSQLFIFQIILLGLFLTRICRSPFSLSYYFELTS